MIADLLGEWKPCAGLSRRTACIARLLRRGNLRSTLRSVLRAHGGSLADEINVAAALTKSRATRNQYRLGPERTDGWAVLHGRASCIGRWHVEANLRSTVAFVFFGKALNQNRVNRQQLDVTVASQQCGRKRVGGRIGHPEDGIDLALAQGPDALIELNRPVLTE